MEAAPKLPMISFDMKICTETQAFAPALKQYIQAFYNEDPESYSTEIHNLEGLRAAAIRPTIDVAGCQTLKKYYCQLHFLKSRFPMEDNQMAAVHFSWKDNHSSLHFTMPDIRYELMCILYNIGALHSQLGTLDTRSSPEGMKMACTHFQCAAWAFQGVKKLYGSMVNYISSMLVVHFLEQICLAQAQECILEKSMLDNRKATIIAKVAVAVHDFYRSSLVSLQAKSGESSVQEVIGSKTYKEWHKYVSFKEAYHKCIALLFQGQQAEEQQKMGERVAFYQAACEKLEEARKLASNLKDSQEITEALAFTLDVVEGKRKAAKNDNEFIYHEEVPAKEALQEVKGACLVKGIPFNVNDPEVSGPDLFARLVPMEAHEASSLYSEKKAQMLRQLGEVVESKDQSMAEFMSSMQLDLLNKMRVSSGIPQEIVDRAAAMSAKPTATQDLIDSMNKLSNIYQEVESMLNEIDSLLKEEESSEKEYQEIMGKRPPSIIATDLSREAAKYREAHTKANDSNQTLHRAMTAHVANLKILAQPLRQLQQQLPSIDMSNPNIDEAALKELETLIAKVEEMRSQRAMLWAQLREAVHNDDITSVLVTKQPNQTLDAVFQQELEKHQQLANLIEQNAAAQENIKKALVDAYANSLNTRRYLQDVIQKRHSTISSLVASYDSYDDLLAKANKGIEFYTKLETNVSKLLQRIKSACKVQQEERDQMLSKNTAPKTEHTPTTQTVSTGPKLKDYLEARKKTAANTFPDSNVPQYPSMNYTVPQNIPDQQSWPPAVRPAPLGSEVNDPVPKSNTQEVYYPTPSIQYYQQDTASGVNYSYQNPEAYAYNASQYPTNYNSDAKVDDLASRMNNLISSSKNIPYSQQYSYSNYIPQNYSQSYTVAQTGTNPAVSTPQSYNYDPNKAYTSTTNSYQPISSHSSGKEGTDSYQAVSESVPTYAQYTNPAATNSGAYATQYQDPNYSNSTNPSSVNYAAQYPSQYSQTYNQESSYYPPGYSPNFNPPTTQATDYSSLNYHSAQYASSVQPNVSNMNHSTYSSPPIDTNTIKSSDQSYNYATNYQQYPTGQTYDPATYNQQYSNQSTDQASYTQTYPNQATYPQTYGSQSTDQTAYYQNYGTYENYYGQTYGSNVQNYNQTNLHSPQIPSTSQNVPQSAPQTPQPLPSVQVVDTQTPKKESNIDLLSGLDFNISQAPLVPQQNISKVVEPEEKPATEPIKPVVKTSSTDVEKPKPITPAVKILQSKSLTNQDVKRMFNQEIEKFEKFVDVLPNKTLSGPTNLDLKWKEIQDKLESDGQKKIISVARCYPMKNRFPDILPYDSTRVELCESKDDYINASFIKDLSPYAPLFIVTQAPLASTFVDFWTMIREQQVELIFCMLNDSELENDVYFPREKGKYLTVSNMVISLQSVIVKTNWTERLISVTVPEKRESWTVMHLQFTTWPGSLFPNTADGVVDYTKELISLFQQQRSVTHPVVVHCSSGIGRSGLLCLLTAAILDVTNNPTSVPDLVSLSLRLSNCKKNILRDREHLKFAYEAFLCYMKQLVAQDKLKNKLSDVLVQDSQQAVEINEVNVDPLSSLDPFWANKK